LRIAERIIVSGDDAMLSVAWSAMRTGVSMLDSERMNLLRPFLRSNNRTETSMVCLRMIVRHSQAQPPQAIDGHRELSEDVAAIASAFASPYLLGDSRNAAVGHLSVLALAALGSSQLLMATEAFANCAEPWFLSQLRRKLLTLPEEWSKSGRLLACPEVKRLAVEAAAALSGS
jgi:hypothetical protein